MRNAAQTGVAILLCSFFVAGCGSSEEGEEGDDGVELVEGVDLSAFSEFDYSRESGKICYLREGLYETHTASIKKDAGEYILSQSVMVSALAGDQQCVEEHPDGFCVAEHAFDSRALSEEETSKVDRTFQELFLRHNAPYSEFAGSYEPCLYSVYRWDDAAYPNSGAYLDTPSQEVVNALLEELRANTCKDALSQRSELQVELTITDDVDGAPFSGVSARCADGTEISALSDDEGKMSFSVNVRGNPQCGIVDCSSLVFSHPTELAQERELDLQKIYMQEVSLRRK